MGHRKPFLSIQITALLHSTLSVRLHKSDLTIGHLFSRCLVKRKTSQFIFEGQEVGGTLLTSPNIPQPNLFLAYDV